MGANREGKGGRTLAVGLVVAIVSIVACCAISGGDDPPPTPLVVDVHAHVLHASDVPLRAFGEKVLGMPRWLARLVQWWLRGGGEAKAAFQTLAGGEDGARAEIDEQTMRALLRATLEDLAPDSRPQTMPEIDEPLGLMKFDPALVDREEEAADRELEQVLRELLGRTDWEEVPEVELREMGLLGGEEAHACVARRPGIFALLAGLFRFACVLRLPGPSEVARRYFQTFASGTGGAPNVDLVTPAMMNMSAWLGQGSDHDIREQIEELGALVEECRGRLHPFFAFDPCERWDVSRAQLERALALGFVGVKVYPPMGYLPWGNAGKPPACDRLPCEAEDVDANLTELYGYCERMGVPILAHCSNPGAAACEKAGLNADPENWRPVLEQFRGLHLSFGHFGGGGFVEEGGWADTIVDLMLALPDVHVYADVSYHDWPFDPGAQVCYVEALKRLLARGALVQERILFGTDWSMIAREPWQADYVGGLLQLVEDEFPDLLARISGQNALEYLGLVPGGKNHERLLRYYADEHIPLAEVPWLNPRR